MTNEPVKLTEEQQAAADEAIDTLLGGGGYGEFAIGGFAGTGKTTVAANIMKRLETNGVIVSVVTPSGKAADVLRQKGILTADTIHSLIYELDGVQEKESTGEPEPIFRHNEMSGIVAAMVIVDEASMVSEDIANDLRKTCIKANRPILWIGDHGQLPPVGKDPGIMAHANVRLETIHRQAAESPIQRLAHVVRLGSSFRRLTCADTRVKFKNKDSEAAANLSLETGAQILCGTNRTRHRINAWTRKKLGYTGKLVAGEKVVCLLNHRPSGLFNGQIYTVESVGEEQYGEIFARLKREDGKMCGVCLYAPVLGRGRQFDDPEPEGARAFDYAYAITVHKSQGSEWKDVILYDEACFGESQARWRYTGVTRAKQTLTVFR